MVRLGPSLIKCTNNRVCYSKYLLLVRYKPLNLQVKTYNIKPISTKVKFTIITKLERKTQMEIFTQLKLIMSYG